MICYIKSLDKVRSSCDACRTFPGQHLNVLLFWDLTLNHFVSCSLAEYAQVVKMLGGGRVLVQCYDGVTRQGLIRGTMRRRVWINTVRSTAKIGSFDKIQSRHSTHLL